MNNDNQTSDQVEVNNGFASGPENLHTLMSGPVFGENGELSHYRVVLSWIPATSVLPIVRYEIYRGTEPTSMLMVGETNLGNFTDNTVETGLRYFYFVIAYNNMNQASPMSNMTSVTV
jgi:hypothetical protein